MDDERKNYRVICRDCVIYECDVMYQNVLLICFLKDMNAVYIMLACSFYLV